MQKHKTIFITGTDTGVGKTVATFVLAVLAREAGINAGVMKPVQCAGDDAQFLMKELGIDEDLNVINPCYTKEALSPHLSLRRAGKHFDLTKVKQAHALLSNRYDVLFVEGAGGLMVPLTKSYYNVDLIKDLNAQAVIVSRLDLGTINHTLLTVELLKQRRIPIKGIIFSDSKSGRKNIAQRSNPLEIAKLSNVKVMGTIPFMRKINAKEVLAKCAHLDIK